MTRGESHPEATAPPHLPRALEPGISLGLERWYTLARGLRSLRWTALESLANGQAREPEVGEALAVLDPGPRSLGTRSALARLTSAGCSASCSADLTLERFVLLPGTGGGRVLVPTGTSATRALGTSLLPAGRRRWRVLAQLLERDPSGALLDRCGRPELLVLSRPDPAATALAPLGEQFVAMAEGVPGPTAKRVVTMGGAGLPTRVLKQAMADTAAAGVARELRALQELQGCGVAPELLDAGGGGESTWLLQTALTGRRGPDQLDARHGAFVSTLNEGRGGKLDYTALPGIRLARVTLQGCGQHAQADERATLMELERILERRLRRRNVPIAYAHGDFTPWNLRALERGLMAFDWELSEARQPWGFDVLHHHFQVGILVHHEGAEALLRAAPAALTSARIQCADLEQDEAIGLYLLIAACRDLATLRLGEAAHEQMGWLRETRRRCAQLLLQRLSASGPSDEVQGRSAA